MVAFGAYALFEYGDVVSLHGDFERGERCRLVAYLGMESDFVTVCEVVGGDTGFVNDRNGFYRFIFVVAGSEGEQRDNAAICDMFDRFHRELGFL